jgi:hypothetical protein
MLSFLKVSNMKRFCAGMLAVGLLALQIPVADAAVCAARDASDVAARSWCGAPSITLAASGVLA